jgi:predicted DNA-binding WGR domain protein
VIGVEVHVDRSQREPAERGGDRSYVPAMPRLVAGNAGARKFWHGWVDGTELTVKFGKLGTAGTSQTKPFDSPERAARELDRLVKQKLAKGYTDARWKFDFDSGLAVIEVVDLPPREQATKKARFTVADEPGGDVRARVNAGEVAVILRDAGAVAVVELYTNRGRCVEADEYDPGGAPGRALFVRWRSRPARRVLAGCAVRSSDPVVA